MQPIKNNAHDAEVLNTTFFATERGAGFTLIEIMVAIAILGILSAVAYPSYRSSVKKAKRAEGRAALMQIMQQEERYYSQHTTYIEFSSGSSDIDQKKFKWFSADRALASAYELSADACPNDTIQACVKLTAKPGTGKVDSSYVDTECGNLTLTSGDVKAADAKNCW